MADLEKDTPELKLTWEAVVEQFESLIKFAAKQQIDNYGADLILSAEDLYQEGMIKLYDCWLIWCVDLTRNKDMDEFAPIFKTSLFRVMRNKGKKPSSKSGDKTVTAIFVDIDDVGNSIKDDNADDTVERMYQVEGIEKLKDMLTNDISVRLLEELADPSPRTLFEVWADIKRKEMVKSQGVKTNIPKDNTVRMKHIIRSLGITGKQYDVAIVEIREMAKLALTH